MSFLMAEVLDEVLAGDDYQMFRRKYFDRLPDFMVDCFRYEHDEGPTDYHLRMAETLMHEERLAVRGPHGLGKTYFASQTILWFALTRDIDHDWKIPITASVWRQLTKYLLPELKKWAGRVKWHLVGRQPFNRYSELLAQELKLNSGMAFAVATDDPTAIEGAHARQLMYVFDESKAIPDETFDAAEGAFANAGKDTGFKAFALAISTPGEPKGRFYDIHRRAPGYEDWSTIFVTKNEAIAAGRISREWAEQRARQWGTNSAVYLNRVEGEFASSEEDGVIPLALVEQAIMLGEAMQEGELGKVSCISLDVGVTGDKSIEGYDYECGYIDVNELGKFNPTTALMELAGLMKAHIEKHKTRGIIDVIGVGAGTTARLIEQGVDVAGFNAAEKTLLMDSTETFQFANKRSAAWWLFREELQNAVVGLPNDDELIGELTAPRYRITSAGKIQIETKVEIKRRLGRSTDKADAVIMARVGPRLVDHQVQVMSLKRYLSIRGSKVPA